MTRRYFTNMESPRLRQEGWGSVQAEHRGAKVPGVNTARGAPEERRHADVSSSDRPQP